jgi:N-acetylglucosaminyldiphosphoundecaprenol N-acetyl-beta-D-mannosaminyltransferase
MRIKLLNVPVDLLSLGETLTRVEDAMQSRQRLHHVALNVAKLVSLQTNDELRHDVFNSDIVGIDGMGIVLAARLLGYQKAERVSGVDLMEEVLALCDRRGLRPYFLGAELYVVMKAVTMVCNKYPNLKVAGYHDGYFGSAGEAAVMAKVQETRPDCLFIGMPTPQKERLLRTYRDTLGIPFIMGVGGGIDVLAGKVKRAPQWMQNNGLEWVYRIYQEPSRMWWRYLTTNTYFAIMLVRILFKRLSHLLHLF